MLEAAVRHGRLERAEHVDATAFPHAARTYLADGTGLAWTPPVCLQDVAGFAVDGEIVAAVRPSLVRRFGIDDPVTFARLWTRAEALAKLADTPIITWLSRHGLAVPSGFDEAHGWAWRIDEDRDVIVTRAVLLQVEEAEMRVVPGLSASPSSVGPTDHHQKEGA